MSHLPLHWFIWASSFSTSSVRSVYNHVLQSSLCLVLFWDSNHSFCVCVYFSRSRLEAIKSSCNCFLMKWQMSTQFWTYCPGRIPKTLRWDEYNFTTGKNKSLHIFFINDLETLLLSSSINNCVFYHLLIPDLGNSLYVAVMAIHDLPHTIWPVSSGWRSRVRWWQAQRAHHGPHSGYCKGMWRMYQNLYNFTVISFIVHAGLTLYNRLIQL